MEAFYMKTSSYNLVMSAMFDGRKGERRSDQTAVVERIERE